jgi:hypothetical protein
VASLAPRGLTSIAVAAFAVSAGVAGSEVKVVVASAVAATVALFAIAFPLLRRHVVDPDVLSLDLTSDPASRIAQHVAPDEQARRTLRSTSDAEAMRETQPSVDFEGEPAPPPASSTAEPDQRGPLPPPNPPPPRTPPNRTTQPGMPVPSTGSGRKPGSDTG